jgi:hypothetical protein
MNEIKKIIVHWSASRKYTTVEQLRAWHKAKGWRDIGYHRLILHPDSLQLEGELIRTWGDLVKLGRKLNDDKFLLPDEVGAHTLGFNSDSVAICVVGNKDYGMHSLQKVALSNVLTILTKRFNLNPEQVHTHRELNPTACPGDEIHGLVMRWRKLNGVGVAA